MDQISHESLTSFERSQSNQAEVGGFLVIHLGTHPRIAEEETKSKGENFTWVKKEDGTYQAYCSSCRRKYDQCPKCEKGYEQNDFKKIQKGICVENLNAHTDHLKTEIPKIKPSQNLKGNGESLLKRKYQKRISLNNSNVQTAIQEKIEIPKIIKVSEKLKEKINKKKRMSKEDEEKSKGDEEKSKTLSPTLSNPSQIKSLAEISVANEVPESPKDLNV